MRIAIFTDTYRPQINGVATSAFNLVKTLRAHGEQVVVVTTNPFDNEFSYEDGIMRIPGVKLKHLYHYVMAGVYNANAMEILTEFQPDVVHVQTEAGIGQFGFMAAKRLHAGVVYTFHTMMEDYTYYFTHGLLDRGARTAVRGFIKHEINQADEFITPSQKIQEYMRSIGVDEYINVIPTGLDFSIYEKSSIDQKKVASLRSQLNIPSDTYVVLSLGRVAKEKSIDVCLRGYAKYLAARPSAKTLFLLVGGGPALEELKSLAASLGILDHCRFTGAVEPTAVPLYYALGNVFVSASTTETQGLTFMEAMASSLVLFCRYDESLESLIKEGENGFFFADEDDFAKKLPGIISLPSSTLLEIVQAEQKANEPYSLERFYQRVMEVYHRAVKKNW